MTSDPKQLDPFGRPIETQGIGGEPLTADQVEALRMQRDAQEALETDDDDYSDLVRDAEDDGA